MPSQKVQEGVKISTMAFQFTKMSNISLTSRLFSRVFTSNSFSPLGLKLFFLQFGSKLFLAFVETTPGFNSL